METQGARYIPGISGVKPSAEKYIPGISGVNSPDERYIPSVSGVKIEVLKEGHRFLFNGKSTKIYSLQEMDSAEFSNSASIQLGVDPSDILKVQYHDVERELTYEELSEILGITIKKDKATKVIAFLNCLLTYTERDQTNMAMQAESSSGKSYVITELLEYFPKEDVMIYGNVSPTAFFHEQGVLVDRDTNDPIDLSQKPGPDATLAERETWNERMRNSRILVDLEKKILVFLDQPHYRLEEYLRPLLSHDKKIIEYSITDRSEKFGLRTKKVRLRGFPTVIICSTRANMDNQEKTRMFLLSPETSVEKLNETIDLIALKFCDQEQYDLSCLKDARRKWLMTRVSRIKTAGIKDVIIDSPRAICSRFKETHKHLIPRHQRDLPRLIGLIKGHAILNERQREHIGTDRIKATQADIDAGFILYESIAEPNELGITPHVWEIYEQVIKPRLSDVGLEKQDILSGYRRIFHRSLSHKELAEEILPTLEGAGLIIKDQHPTDKRRIVVYPTDAGDISHEEGIYPTDARDISHPRHEDHPTDAGDISQTNSESACYTVTGSKLEVCSNCENWRGSENTPMALCFHLGQSTSLEHTCQSWQPKIKSEREMRAGCGK